MTNKQPVEQLRWLAQADLLLVTADLLRSPENSANRASSLHHDEIEQLVRASCLTPFDSLVSALIDVIRSAEETDPELWSGCWRLLFDASLYCPINESAYVRRDKGAIIGDVCGFYRAFGWQPANNGERPDHLLTEMEFMAVLLILLARASTESDTSVTHNAMEKFSRDHLADWLPAFAKKLEQSTSLPVLKRLAHWIDAFWDALVRYHGWEIDPQPCLRSNPGNEPEDVYECGAPDLVQISRHDAS